jgi:hypothetical protein
MLEKEIPESQYFQVQGGPKPPTLLALRTYLRMIPLQQFNAHVTKEKNDFANWIEHVFGEIELAQRIRAAMSREQIVWLLDDAFAEVRMQKVIKDQEVKSLPEVATLEDDQKFDAYKGDIVSTNEKISNKYEQIAKQMQDALNTAVPKEIEQRMETLKTRYSELLQKISETRKQGRDTIIPALVAKQFTPKLVFAQVSREEKDFQAAEVVLAAAEAELREVQNEKEINVKKEVLALAGQA